MDVHLAIESFAENVLAEKLLAARFLYRPEKNLRAVWHLTTDINVGRVRADGIARDENTFDKLMRIVMNKLTILERAGFGFIGVANEIDRLAGALGEEAPFQAAWETGATATANLAVLDLGDDFFRLHAERF